MLIEMKPRIWPKYWSLERVNPQVRMPRDRVNPIRNITVIAGAGTVVAVATPPPEVEQGELFTARHGHQFLDVGFDLLVGVVDGFHTRFEQQQLLIADASYLRSNHQYGLEKKRQRIPMGKPEEYADDVADQQNSAYIDREAANLLGLPYQVVLGDVAQHGRKHHSYSYGATLPPSKSSLIMILI